jgi:hypothetical protein
MHKIAVVKTPQELLKPVVCQPIDNEWKTSLQDKWWSTSFKGTRSAAESRLFDGLITHILTFGGEMVCLPFGESLSEQLVKFGIFLYGDDARVELGKRSGCHENASKIVLASPDNRIIGTGYALSDDGMWRGHSWCIDTDNGQIIETTEKRVAYFGIVVGKEDSISFANHHVDG